MYVPAVVPCFQSIERARPIPRKFGIRCRLADTSYIQSDDDVGFSASATKVNIHIGIIFLNFSADQSFFSRIFGEALYPRMHFNVATNVLRVQYRLDSVQKIADIANVSNVLKLGKLYRFRIEFDAAVFGVRVYVDDVLVTQNSDLGSTFEIGTNPFRLGRDENLSRFADCIFTYFKVENIAGATVMCEYDFDEGFGNNITDKQGNVDMTLMNDPEWVFVPQKPAI